MLGETKICVNCNQPDFKHDEFGYCPDINMKRFVEKKDTEELPSETGEERK